ncbi:hypothetical protein [Corynebacterium casei]|uniref:hypothetical protein n=1 Tax=Corynebacterium casei TaxID=160386 RepID=UPI002648D1F5|nr:hypothetical protein [Corynebacterium casei]MDN5707304.1 hypothetical protein [Corynebacterium casei]MDN5707504.1 hypothetical protein [Corynebacterium casei]
MDIDNTQVEETNPDVQPEGTSETWGNSPRDAEPMDGIEEQPDSQNGENEEQQQAFDRKYVEKLRKESAKYRDKAKRAEELEKRLHRSLVAQDGRLADPDDMEFNPDHLHDADALSDAITKLVASKPGLKAQQLSGDVGAGVREKPKPPTTDLLSIMKGLI